MTVMMGSMQTVSKRARAAAGPTEQFVELCKTLYGEHVDPEIIWSDVVKLSPDQADLNASAQRQARVRRNVERASNAVGIAAGGLGLSAALKDDRLADGGRLSRKLHATGQRLPKALGRIKSRRAQAALAGGALATQVGNLGGDALIAGTLAGDKRKTRRDVSKAVPSDLRPQVDGLRNLWRQPSGGSLQPTKPQVAKPPAPKKPGAPSSQGAPAGQKPLKPQQPLKPQRPVAKAADDVEFAGEFSKFDDAKRQAFGWASVVKVNGQPVIDRQGDYIDLEDLETAAYQYVHKSRVGGDMHRRNGDQAHKVSDMIESMVFTDDKIAKMGLPDDFPRGWWVGYQIHDEGTWQEVRKKGRTGFSIHGRGVRKEHTLDDVMGY